MIKPKLSILFFVFFVSDFSIKPTTLSSVSSKTYHTFSYVNFHAIHFLISADHFIFLSPKTKSTSCSIPIRKIKAQPVAAENVRMAYSLGCPQGVLVKTSSVLANTGVTHYSGENLLDDSAQTAWSEGEANNGIGAYIEFTLIDKISIVDRYLIENGYAKNKSTYSSCNRVKTLHLHVNEKEVAQIELADTFLPQEVNINPSGWQKIHLNKGDKLKFIIKEVYKGSDRDHTFLSTFTPLCK